jgi:site-specific DNA-methyltransferase (adenine-specific)
MIHSYNCHYNDLMSTLPDKFINIAICDIPYGIGADKMAYTREVSQPTKQKNGSKLNPYKNKKVYTQNDWDIAVPPQQYFDELRRVSNEQIIFGVEYVDWQGLGPGRIKWDKCVPEKLSFKGYEMAYCSMIDYEMEIKLLWSGMRQAKSLAEPTIQQGNKKLNEKRFHPTGKPVLLYRKLLQTFAKPGMKILDTHSGALSIGIACEDFGCDLYHSEINTEYFNIGQKRIYDHNHNPQQKLFPSGELMPYIGEAKITSHFKAHIENQVIIEWENTQKVIQSSTSGETNRSSNIDFDKIEKRLDIALEKETSESLDKWLMDRRSPKTEHFVIVSYNDNGRFEGYLTYYTIMGMQRWEPRLDKAILFDTEGDCIFKNGQKWEAGRDGGTGYYKVFKVQKKENERAITFFADFESINKEKDTNVITFLKS